MLDIRYYKGTIYQYFMIEFDPFTEDPIEDLDYPATQATFPIFSHGSHLNAIIEIAQGQGPHPTIILLHGFPGNEKNFDLAHIFRRSGFNVLIFYYRGSWGSGGIYSFQNCVDDVESVIEHLCDPITYQNYRIDPTNIILIGHSWGGFVAMYAGVHDDRIHRVASISGLNIGAFGKWLQNHEVENNVMYNLLSNVGPLRGTSGKQLLEEIMNRHHFWDLTDLSAKFVKKDICITGAINDEVLPIDFHHRPLIECIQEISDANLTTKEFITTHSYSDHRIALAKFLLKWLNEPKHLI